MSRPAAALSRGFFVGLAGGVAGLLLWGVAALAGWMWSETLHGFLPGLIGGAVIGVCLCVLLRINDGGLSGPGTHAGLLIVAAILGIAIGWIEGLFGAGYGWIVGGLLVGAMLGALEGLITGG